MARPKFKQKCAMCKENWVIMFSARQFPICVKCHMKQIDKEIKDPKMKKFFDIPKKFYEDGLHIITARTERNLPGAINPRIKSLNYLNNILAKIDAIKKGSPEAIMLTHDGYVAECTGDNIFIVKGKKLITPPVSIGALEGITRNTVIDIVKKKRIRCVERKFKLNNVYTSNECFLTGTAAEIIPVVRVDGKKIGNGRPGKLTRVLMEGFRRRTKTNGVRY